MLRSSLSSIRFCPLFAFLLSDEGLYPYREERKWPFVGFWYLPYVVDCTTRFLSSPTVLVCVSFVTFGVYPFIMDPWIFLPVSIIVTSFMVLIHHLVRYEDVFVHVYVHPISSPVLVVLLLISVT